MSPTPLTDAAAEWIADRGMTEWVPIEVSRSLELRLAAEETRYASAVANLEGAGRIIEDLEARLAALQAKERKMREALEISRGNVASLCAAHPMIWSEWLKVLEAALSPVPPHAGAENTPAAAPGNEI